METRFVDFLESRTFLSVGGDDFELAVDPGITEQGVMMPMVATTSAATRAIIPLKKGYYSGKTSMGGKTGNIILQVASVSSTAFSGTIKSADWGAFSVTVSGKISGNKVTFSGKNSYTQIKSFSGSVSGSILSGKLSVVQNGLSVSGNFSGTYAKTAPAMGNVIEPNVKNTSYNIKTNEGDRFVLAITNQIDGKIWGTVGGSKFTGVILSTGEFRIITKESDGKTDVTGKLKSSKMEGEWKWYGNDGDKGSGTFTGTKR